MIFQRGKCDKGIFWQEEPVEPYSSDDLDWTNDNSRVTREHDNESERAVELVDTTVENWDDYDTVFIGYPIWWGIAAWPDNALDSMKMSAVFGGSKIVKE